MAYITTGQLCSYLGIPDPTHADEVQLATFIAAAQSIIERQTHRTFEATTDTTRTIDYGCETIRGPFLWLPGDLCQITTITNGDGVVVTAGQYVTEPRNLTPWYALRLRSDANLSWTYAAPTPYENAIAIEGRWAYSLFAPPDIQQATARLASWLYRQKDTGQAGIDSPILAGDGNVIMPTSLPADVRMLIRPYVRAI